MTRESELSNTACWLENSQAATWLRFCVRGSSSLLAEIQGATTLSGMSANCWMKCLHRRQMASAVANGLRHIWHSLRWRWRYASDLLWCYVNAELTCHLISDHRCPSCNELFNSRARRDRWSREDLIGTSIG